MLAFSKIRGGLHEEISARGRARHRFQRIARPAQPYPSRPITLVVPLGVGGSTDVIARIMAEGMRDVLEPAIVVENTTGAGGTIGVGRVARAAPDGYTLGIGQWGTNVASGAIYPLQFDLVEDFEPVGLIATQPFLIVARKTMPAEQSQGPDRLAEGQSDKASQGNSGVGTPSHVGGLMFQKAIGAKWTMVPYRGAGQSMQDLVAGQIDVQLDTPAVSMPQVRGRQHQGLCGDRQDAHRDRAGNSDHRRSRPARFLFLVLACLLGAEGHAEGDRREAQRRAGEGARRSRHPRRS